MRQETLRRRVELARASRASAEMSGGFDADLVGEKYIGDFTTMASWGYVVAMATKPKFYDLEFVESVFLTIEMA